MSEEQIKAARAELETLDKKHSLERAPLVERLHRLIDEFHHEKFGVKVGSIVTVTARGIVKTYLVVKVRQTGWIGAKPWITGRLQKKNGSFSEIEHQIYYDWEICR